MIDEQDSRLPLMNSLLNTPHRDVQRLQPLHAELASQDAHFYTRMAAWYCATGVVRDHKVLFIANLCVSVDPAQVQVGIALLLQLPPYLIAEVVRFIKGTAVTRRVEPTSTTQVRRRKKHVQPPTITEQIGLRRNVPRPVRRAIEEYLRALEAQPERFDRAVMRSRADIKFLYAGLHLQAGPRADAILFKDNPPHDSSLWTLKQIAKMADPADQARALVQARVPYPVASLVIKQMTPMVLTALIHAMTPAEVINNLDALQRRGALDNDDLQAVIHTKLEQAQHDPRVAAYKAQRAGSVANATGALAAALDKITDVQLEAKGRIRRPTAVFVDKSGSMDEAIALGIEIAALASGIMEPGVPLYVYVYDSLAMRITAQGTQRSDWERAFVGIRAKGSTACGAPLEMMRRRDERVEQIINIGDQRENKKPSFGDAYTAYAAAVGVRPDVILVNVGNPSTQIEQVCEQLGVNVQTIPAADDYYALPNIIQFLTRPSQFDLLMDILDFPLPMRKAEAAVEQL